MGLEFLDSFEGYSTNELPLRWTGSSATIISNGRNGKGCQIPSGGGLNKSVAYNNAWVVGFAFKINASSVQAGVIYNALTPGASNLCGIRVEADGSVSVISQASPIPIGNTSSANYYLSTNTWYYFEIKYNIQPTTDSSSNPALLLTVQGLRINKQTILSGLTAVIPFNYSTGSLTGQPKLNQHNWGFFNGNPGSCIVDDLYIFNQDVGPNSDYAGDIRILIIFPDQDLLTPFSKVGGNGTSYSCITEVPPDYNTSYLYDNVNEDFENFNWQPLPAFFGNVICVQYTIFARKDAEGSRAFQHTMGPGPSNLSQFWYVGDSYLYYMWELDTAPGGSTWSVAIFNSTSFGFKIATIPVPS